MQEGVAGLLRDKTRPSRISPLGAEVAERVIALTQQDPPDETTGTIRNFVRGRAGSLINPWQP